MTKFEKSITVNIGNYENFKIGVSEADSFDECDVEIRNHLANLMRDTDMEIDKPIGDALHMQTRKKLEE